LGGIVCARPRHAAVGATLNRLGRLVDREVVHRQLAFVPRRRAGHGALEVHTAPLGLHDVFVPAVPAVGIHRVGLAIMLRELIQHRLERFLVRLVRRLHLHARDQLHVVVVPARLGNLGLVARALMAIVRRIRVRRVLHDIPAGLGFHRHFRPVLRNRALFFQDATHRLVTRPIRHRLLVREPIRQEEQIFRHFLT